VSEGVTDGLLKDHSKVDMLVKLAIKAHVFGGIVSCDFVKFPSQTGVLPLSSLSSSSHSVV
jgi:hypothetical protein